MRAKEEHREILNLIASLGGKVIDSRTNKHTCLRVQFGYVQRTITFSATSSDWRAHKNKLSQIKRIARDVSANP